MPNVLTGIEEDARLHYTLDNVNTKSATECQSRRNDRTPDSGLSRCGVEETSRPRTRGSLDRVVTALDDEPQYVPVQQTTTSASAGAPLYSVFTRNQKRFIVFMAAWAGFFSPVSGNIYFPALNPLAKDLNVSNTLINLTLTSYMIFQGLAPSFFGEFADAAGRRPAYAVCFIVYIAANIGLALQNSYPALFVLRCLQSTGSAATIPMASAVVADIATAAERGTYIGAAISGSLLGPAIGPVIGGVLAEFLGWRAIFWFLTIMGAAFMLVFAIFLPETARTQVGDGSIPPKGWNMSFLNYLAVRRARRTDASGELITPDERHTDRTKRTKIGFPNPLSSLYIILDKENALLLFYNAFLFAAFYVVGAAIPSQFAEMFHFNELQIGLCYLPYGCGSALAAFTTGHLLDRNFARWCKTLGVTIKKGRDQDLSTFPIERARLQIALPAAYSTAVLVCTFGWILHFEGPLAALLVILFFTSFAMSIAFNVTTTLLVDFYPKNPATASAANNLTRCLLGAGFTAAVLPMIDGMGRGWTFTFLTLFLIVTSPMLWLIYLRGMRWRQERNSKEENTRKLKQRELEDGADNQMATGSIPGVAEKLPLDGGVSQDAIILGNSDANERPPRPLTQPTHALSEQVSIEAKRGKRDEDVESEKSTRFHRVLSYDSGY